MAYCESEVENCIGGTNQALIVWSLEINMDVDGELDGQAGKQLSN